MKFEVHRLAAGHHFKIASDFDRRLALEKGTDEKAALRVVAAQNYFYSAVNAIEAVFAEKLEKHSFSHENRFRTLLENRASFSAEVVELYEAVDRNLRNQVAYRGENGKKYSLLKKLSELLMQELR